jgi:glycosyltransferase involved in cell wall biosynthesis
VCAIVGGPEGGLIEALRAAGVRCLWTPMRLTTGPGPFKLPGALWTIPSAAIRLARLLRRERIQIVHTHGYNANLIGRVAAWIARVPIRISMVSGPYPLEAPLPALADRLTSWMDHRVVAACEHIRTLCRATATAPGRTTCIYYGADADRFDPARANGARIRRELGLDADAPLVGLIAYLYPPVRGWVAPRALRGHALKGHEYFLDAARLVRQALPHARFLLVGGAIGPAAERYRAGLEAHARALGLADAVRFAGFRPDVPDVLDALDVAVQCSLSEGLGGTIESLLMGVPTVATRVGGMPESVRDEETGLLVPPRDAAALANAILRLLTNRQWARALAAAGRERMRARFTLQRTITDIDALYRAVAQEQALSLRLPTRAAEPFA